MIAESSIDEISEKSISLRPESVNLHYSATKNESINSSKPDPKAFRENGNSTSFKPERGVENMKLKSSKENKHMRFNQNKRSHSESCLDMTDRFNAEEEAVRHCNKAFHLKDSSSDSHRQWVLPPTEGLYTHDVWVVDELQQKKEDLNHIKSQLDHYDTDTWHQHTYNCNPAQKISFTVKSRANPELLTQAFLKFYEILHALPVVPEHCTNMDSLYSMHLCEAPGAFIVALNHFLALQWPNIKLKWVANTLNPYYEGTPFTECITDDRLILHTLDNWCFGKDDIGNLMSPEYFEELKTRMEGQKVDVVTADGSVDCQRNPADQESMTQCLHFCEVYTSLCFLREGGSFVIKTFTFFEAESFNLMYLISCCFSDVYLLKPITSKLGNSEVYIVATGFSPPQSLNCYLEALAKFYGKPIVNKTLFKRDEIPKSFFNQIINCCEFFKTHQTQAIERNISLYGKATERDEEYCSLLKSIVLRIFFEKTECRAIDPSLKLVAYKLAWDKNVTPKTNFIRWGEQFNKKPRHEKLQFLNDQLQNLSKGFTVKCLDNKNYVSRDVFVAKWVAGTMSLGRGQPMHFIYTSRFCNTNLMHAWISYFMECATEDEIANVKHGHTSNIGIYSAEFYEQDLSQDYEDAKNEILKTYPESLILDEGFFPAPHACHCSFDQLLDMIKDGKIHPGTSVAIIHSPLLTRLQNGLVCLLSSLFEKLVFWEPVNLSERSPFFVLNNFTSVEKGKCLSDSMEDMGWSVDREQINRVLPMKSLIFSRLHAAVCRYNGMLCLRHLNLLKRYQNV